MRISTPDLDVVMGFMFREKTEMQKRYIAFAFRRWISKTEAPSDMRVVNDMFRNWGHQFIYDRKTLQGLMEEAGFVECATYKVGESGDPHLREVERHGRVMGDDLNAHISLVMEGAVPPPSLPGIPPPLIGSPSARACFPCPGHPGCPIERS